MRAILRKEFGGPDVLEIREIPERLENDSIRVLDVLPFDVWGDYAEGPPLVVIGVQPEGRQHRE